MYNFRTAQHSTAPIVVFFSFKNKFCVFITALTFLFSSISSAYAADYIIKIPDTLTVNNSGLNATDGISADCTANDFETNKKLVITASSSNNFALKSGGNSISYTMNKTSWDFLPAELNQTNGASKELNINVEDYSNKPAGNYTDTVTFTAELESITINNAPTEALFVNSKGTLTATILPDNATDKTVTWSSSDPDYVSINATTGEYEVKGTKGYGSATITATAGGKTATCTITGKVTYTSLKAGDVIHTGDTFFVEKVYFNTTPAMSFNNSNGVITLVEDSGCYKFKRGSNGTMPNVTSYKVASNTDGIYIVSGSGTSTSDKFTIAVHTK